MATFLIVPLLPLTTIGLSTFSVGAAIGLLLFPVAIRATAQYRGANLLLAIWVACLLVGPALTALTTSELGRGLDLRLGARLMVLVLGAGVTLYTLLWSRSIIGLRMTVALYAVGSIFQAMSDFSAIISNPWKFAFALPVAVFLLSIARTRAQSTLVLIAVAGLSVALQYRSFAGICVLALLVIWIAPVKGLSTRKLDGRFLVIFPVSVVVLYQVATAGLLNGWFGPALQDLALKQTRGGQVSLIAGARPEFAATSALFQSRPVGFGPGVIPSVDDVATAIYALKQSGVNTNSRYVEDYLFGDKIELHSIVADLWLLFGFTGLFLSAAILWYVLAGLLNSETRLFLGAVGVLVGISALWDMAFSPLSAIDTVVLALALLLPMQEPLAANRQSRCEPDDRLDPAPKGV